MNTNRALLMMSLREAWRGRWLVVLVILLAITGELLIRFSGGGSTTLVSLLDVALILAPLAGLVVGTVQVHGAREVTELLLAQPIRRERLFMSLYLGSALPLALALVAGLLAPFAWHGLLLGAGAPRLLALAGAAAVLAMVSSALAFVIALRVDDRVRALGIAIAAWLVAAILWDGLILIVAMVFGSAPIETPLLLLLALNPLDIARVLLLLGTDAAALLGYTGATLQQALGTMTGRVVLCGTLAAWTVVPLWFARRTFTKRDF